MQTGPAHRLAVQVVDLLDARAVDPREPSRMWLITRVPATGQTLVNEVHPVSRLMHSASGLAFLTPPGRELLGVAYYLTDLALPSPDEVAQRCARELAVPRLSISQRWRWERIARQLPRARERRAKWASFAFDNELGVREREIVGVVMPADRAVVDATTAEPLAAAEAERFWLMNPYSRMAEAVQAPR